MKKLSATADWDARAYEGFDIDLMLLMRDGFYGRGQWPPASLLIELGSQLLAENMNPNETKEIS